MKKKGLYISYFYLPVLVPRSIIGYKHLENSSFNFDVYSKKVTNRKTDNTLIHREGISIYTDELKNSFLTKIFWIKESVKFFKNNNEEYDFIFTSYMPIYSLISGLLIRRKYDIPWISYYSDPPGIVLDNKVSFSKKVFTFFERKIAKISYNKADMLIFTNQEQLEYCLQNTPKYFNKAYVLNHSYEETMYETEFNNETSGPIIISHFGRLYGRRNAIEVIKVVKKLVDQGSIKINEIKLKFFGSISKEQVELIEYYKLSDFFEIIDFVGYQDSLKEMAKSDYLLLIDSDFEPNIFFPSKLADYLGAKKPIIAISSEGTTRRIAEEIGHVVINNVAEEIERVILNLKKESSFNIDNELLEKYNSKNVSQYMDKLILDLLKNR